jgi:hypothetical protein
MRKLNASIYILSAYLIGYSPTSSNNSVIIGILKSIEIINTPTKL